MVSIKFTRIATLGIAAAFALAVGTGQSFAQAKDKKAPAAPAAGQAAAPAGAGGDQKPSEIWYKLCQEFAVPEQKPADASGKPAEAAKPAADAKPADQKKVNICLTQADVRENATIMLVGRLAVRQVQGQDKPQMLVMLPLMSNLPVGAFVKIDEKEPIKLAYTFCDQGGCYAEANVEPAAIEQMKTGKEVSYLGIDVTGRGLKIPLPLEGFAKAIDGPPVPVEKYNDDQRKIAEAIRTRLAELRKQQEDAAKNGGTAPAAGGTAPIAAGAATPATPAPAAAPADKKKK